MTISRLHKIYLNNQGLDFSEVIHTPVESNEELCRLLSIQEDHLLISTPVIDRQGVTFVIHASNSEISVSKLNAALHRNFQLLTSQQASRIFKDCDDMSIPALASIYGVPVVVDQQALLLEQAWLAAGSRTALLKLDKGVLHSVLRGIQSHDCVKPVSTVKPVSQILNLNEQPISSLEDVTRRLNQVYSLPPMPTIAVRILHLVTNPDSTVDDLVEVVEQDPSLAAQMMRYARSALFNFPGKIETVKDAVTIVLGFERVANLAMGIAAKRAFKLPEQGPIGLNRFWKHSLSTAFLCQQFALQMPSSDINPGTAYLSGLLHNFGILLMGEVFTPEYMSLTQLICEHPETPVSVLERQVFGMGWAEDVISLGHGTIGGVLLKLWNLPEPVVKAAAMHQVTHYQGDQAGYVHLVQLANALLSEIDVGENDVYADVDSLFVSLGLKPETGREIAEEALKYRAEIEHLADSLAA